MKQKRKAEAQDEDKTRHGDWDTLAKIWVRCEFKL